MLPCRRIRGRVAILVYRLPCRATGHARSPCPSCQGSQGIRRETADRERERERARERERETESERERERGSFSGKSKPKNSLKTRTEPGQNSGDPNPIQCLYTRLPHALPPRLPVLPVLPGLPRLPGLTGLPGLPGLWARTSGGSGFRASGLRFRVEGLGFRA